ncbi:MAG: nodulation protein NfeD [candidate division Zixibacteria bacterium]|nr:nodulation protein NfeD [candidate division Zixibacteria bacterium]
MRKLVSSLLLSAFWVVADLPVLAQERTVNVLTIESAITPITVKLIQRAVEKSVEEGAEALVIQLNTPGGLVVSTWKINSTLLNADVPVVVYVAPSGARAASAGMFITYAAHIAAMASGTSIGAAHPVEGGGGKMDSTMSEKVTNDAVANVRSAAVKRGRNADWAEEAVRKSVSIPEYEALKLKVIDVVADNLSQLLEKIDGRKVQLPLGERVLKTKGAKIVHFKSNVFDRILEVIVDPTIAYVLMTIGLLGLYFEFSNPGAILPGVIGGISLILAFFAFQALPINYAGVLLILLSMILFILEVKFPSHGILTIGGVVAMFLGSIMLINSSAPYMRISLSVIISTVGATAAFFLFAVGAGIRAQRRQATTGMEGMVGLVAVATEPLAPEGLVKVAGEIWKARLAPLPSEAAAEKVNPNEKVKIVGVENLTLLVSKEK